MNILVVAAHPDDEVLGCGGTIARHTQSGDRVHSLILAEGSTSRGPKRNLKRHETALRGLASAAQKSGKTLGVERVELHGLPDNRMDSLALLDIVKIVEKAVNNIRPALIYTHHLGDVNVDHQRTFEAVMTACRPQPGTSVRQILCFETVSSTEWQLNPARAFVPNWYVDITRTLSTKLTALRHYLPEMREWPHPRSLKAIEHLARWRGASVGLDAAEAFTCVRNIEG